MPRDAELIVREAFIFLKENLDFELLQDDLIQRQLLDEREREDFICRDQCKAFWCERYLKLLITKARCNKFIEFINGMQFRCRISSNLRAEITNSNIMTGADAQRSPITLTHEMLQKHKYFLYTELEPREIADLMFQSGYISCNDHDSITEGQQKYVRFMSLLDILKEKHLYSEFVSTLQTSMKYISVLETFKEDGNLTITSCECTLCIQHSFTLLQKELPDADYTTAVMNHLFDKTNLYDIDHCRGKIRKKSKLMKILLMKGSAACMELFDVIDANLKRVDLIQKMKIRSEIKSRSGLPVLSPNLKRLSTWCLQEQKKYLLDELEPINICDFLFEEKAIEIMTHDNITETAKRRQQVEDLLQTLQENKNDCFHYFLYIIEKNELNDIRNVLGSTLHAEDVRDEIREQSDLKLVHQVEKVTDDPKDNQIELRITVKGRNAERIERDLFQQLESSVSGLWQLFMAYGQMIIEKVLRGSLVLQLRPLTDQAVKTLLNAQENNKLVDIIFGMLQNIKIADKIDGTEQLKIMVQVCYASPAKENTLHGNPEARNAEQIKSRLKAYRKKLISDVEPRALASVLSKHFPKIDFDSVDHADSCPRRVERLLSLVEDGEPDLVKEFLTILKNFGYHDIVELLDPLDVHHTARIIREKIAYNFHKLVEEMQTTFTKETLSNCIGDTDGIRENILPRNGNRKQRMSNFLQFILKEDHNVVEFEKMLKHNGLEKLLEMSERDQEQLVCTQNIEVEFVKDPKPSSSEILFESVITLSHTVPHRQSEDLVTLSGHGSFSGEQPYEPVARSIRTRLSETNRPVTHTSSVQGDTSIDGSSSLSHSFTGDEDITIPKETAATVTPGTMHLLSFDVEPDALQSMTPTTSATVQQSVTSPQNHSSSPSLSQSPPDSGIELGSSESGSPYMMSVLNDDTALESSPASNQIANSVSQKDGPDTAVTLSPERPNTEEREGPSFMFRAFHFSLHAILQPDKVYYPP